MQQNITYNTNTTQNTTITVPRIQTKNSNNSDKTFSYIPCDFNFDILRRCCLFVSAFKAAVSFTINTPFWTTLAYTGQLSGVRMFDIHVTFVHLKFYPWTFQEVPKTTPASKLATKAATVPEIPVRDSKPSPKKLLLQKRIKKMSVRKLQSKEHQRCQNQRKWLKFHPHWKRKNQATIVLWQQMVLEHLVQRKSLR